MKNLAWILWLVISPALSLARATDAITEALNSLTGVTHREVPITEDPSTPSGYRRFELTIEQPVDHFGASHGTFRQRLALLHKDFSEPMVLQTSGYKIFTVKLSAIAQAFGTNQIQVEHRFFEQSAPAHLQWSKLDILQSAVDFHRVTVELKKIYRGKWVNTGGSKGGMTSVYHRRFFPSDLDGTVADVAPLSFSTDDPRYVDFVDQVGGERYRECREKLKNLQVALLQRRSEVLPSFTGSYLYLGGKSVAFEHAVIEMPFTFWQYQNPLDPQYGCANVPAPDAPAAEVVAFQTKAGPLTADTDLLSFLPYFYQAATQLGSPASGLTHLNPHRLHDYHIGQYAPPGTSVSHSDAAMRDVEAWVRDEADHMMFIYGELDPWTAGAFPRASCPRDFHWLQVPGANHGAKVFGLTGEAKEQALAVIRRWLGKREQLDAVRWGSGGTLDDVELQHRRRLRL